MDQALMKATLEVDEHHWWYRGRRRVILAEVNRLRLPPGASVLDAGCGSGRTLMELVRYGEVEGIELDPDAAVAWANSLTSPADFRAAIPLLVSQLDNERVSRTMETFLKNGDPVMELALIEAAAPPGLGFDPDKSRLILDPLIGRDSGLKLTSSEENGSTKDQMLWSSVNQTAKRQAEVGEPAAAMEWLATLPFASPGDYAKAIANVFTVWNLKSEAEAAGWLQTAALDPSLKAAVLKAAKP